MKNLQFSLPIATSNSPPARAATTNSLAVYSADTKAAGIVDACQAAVVWIPDDGSACESYRVPTADERKTLEARKAVLAVTARGCGATDAEKRRAGAAIAGMLDGFTRSRNLDGKAKMEMVAGLVIDLQSLPAWAIERGCERIKRGEVEGIDLAWLPSTPQMYQACAAELADLRAEQRQIEKTLALVPSGGAMTEEERERRAKMAAEWLNRTDPRSQQLGAHEAGTAEMSDTARADRQRFNERSMLSEYQKAGVQPVYFNGAMVSPSLLKSIGALPERAADS